MKQMDLNCDVGEVPEAIADGTQEALLRSITSANIACGGHAGMSRAWLDHPAMSDPGRHGGGASRLSGSRKFRPPGNGPGAAGDCRFRL